MTETFPADFEEFKRDATRGNVVPVVRTLAADLITPFGAYLRLAEKSENSFLFESVEGGEQLARYSFLGAAPQMIARGFGNQTIVEQNGVTKITESTLTDFLRDYFKNKKLSSRVGLPPFAGGAVGFFGYGSARWFEPVFASEDFSKETEDACLLFFRSAVAFDHARQQISIITLVFTDESDNLPELYENALAENEKIARTLEQTAVSLPFSQIGETFPVESNFRREDFEAGVRQIKEHILAGDCYQAVLSQKFKKRTDAAPEQIYRALRRLNPSPYMFLLKIGAKAVVGASPEMLVRCRENKLEYRPIAGTRKRGANEIEDAQLAEEMLADEKEVAEHLMLVDLGRNDLGRVAAFGSVKVEKLKTVEKYSHVQHIVSFLSAQLSETKDRFDALASCFPAGTVTGAPKVRAMQIVNKLEPEPRGVYSGAVGYVDYAGNLDTCIAIRTLVLENGVATVQAGAGIVADSVPELEFEETVNKASGVLQAIELAEKAQTAGKILA
jgi:anthranilate synthase component 1